MTLRETKRTLKNNLRYLRKAGKEVRLSINYKIVKQILRENLQFFEREGLAAYKQIKTVRKLPGNRAETPIIGICEDTVLNMNHNINQSLMEQLHSQNRWLTTYELSIIPDLLKVHLINLAVVGVKSESADILESALKGLHQLKDLDIEIIFNTFSYTEMVFSKDPSGIYPQMDQPTKAYYRNQCAKQAAMKKQNENEYADEILHSSQKAPKNQNHIGFCLLKNTKTQKRRRLLGAWLLACRILLPLSAATALSLLLNKIWLLPLFFPPFHQLLRMFIERIFTYRITPYFMPRMELNQVIPSDQHTLVTVSALLPKADHAKKMAEHLEQLFLANNNGHIDFCLLADFPESKTQSTSDDNIRTEAMIKEIERLNTQYDNRFLLIIRPRVYSKTQRAYSGWERKRGALSQLVQVIRGENLQFHTFVGPMNKLKTVRYILALDQDSELFFNSAYEMITAAAHPLNHPVIDTENGIITDGYGILVPQIANRIDTISTTLFSKIHSGQGGVSAYNALCSNPYQDLFYRTVFCGKGLINVAAYHACLHDTIEPERVLSHDIIEGAFLRCGLVSDVEIADNNPSDSTGWNKRQHRWIRGDFQNSLWLLPTILKNHKRRKNPLDILSRIMITDNLLRAVYPVFSILLLLVATFMSQLAFPCILLAVASVIMPGLASIVVGLIKNGFYSVNRQYYSSLIPESVNQLLRCLIALICLVTNASIALDAALKGLYRQFISHKKCMEWTTAWDVDIGNKNGPVSYLYHNGISLLAGLVLITWGPSYMFSFGIMFALCPLLQWWSGRPSAISQTPNLSNDDLIFLQTEGKKMWRYYAESCTEKENFLPPDNIQEQPVFAVAHRTSPTNIGLMLLSTVCAEDLGYITEKEMVERIERTYSSVEKLERWQGHLLNWYDTQSLEPLFPRYCSTVDSGNFACCLTTVKNRLKTIQSEKAKDLTKRITKELDSIDFRPLYNPHRRLFHIGYDLESKKLSDSYYDMLMSESRMTGYYAIAKRQIPKKHWSALGRTLTRNGRYIGPMSWTGTAFEYLMPPLLLPVFSNTLSFEAIRFCIACQRKDVNNGKPWGCSESGYYEFDDSLNYQYKPHGIRKLALKCFDKQEYVISPYSSFLSLPFVPKAAIKNLRIIEKYNGCGQYGYYEAIDFTNQRCNHSEYETIRSYMAHHVGMSLCALENTINNNYLQTLFMQDEMAGAEVLLMETIPDGSAVYNHLTEKKVPEKPRFPSKQSIAPEIPNPSAPTFALLAGKERKLLIGSTGETISRWKDLLLYGSSKDVLENATGIMIYLECGQNISSLTLSPEYQNADNYRFQVNRNTADFSCKTDEITGFVQTTLSAESTAEIRKITLKNRTSRTLKCRLVIYFEPLLHTPEQIRSHPAFCKLFIQSDFDENTGRMLFEKRTRSSSTPACLAAGFYEQENNLSYQCNTRQAIYHRAGKFLFPKHKENHFSSIPDPCCCISAEIMLNPKESLEKHFVIAAGVDKTDAIKNFENCLAENQACNPLLLNTAEGKLALKLLPYLVSSYHNENRYYRNEHYRQTDLWKVGISGDNPIIVCQIRKQGDLERLKPYLDAWAKLQKYDVISDFVILYKELGDYSRQQYGDIITSVGNCGLSKRIGMNGGIHLVNTATNQPETRKAILAAASYVITRSFPDSSPSLPRFHCIQLLTAAPNDPNFSDKIKVVGGYFSNDRFVVTERPKVPWTHLLANKEFGTQLTNKSLGFTYAHNARENRLTPWSNDPVTHHTGERLILKLADNYYDLIEGSTAEFSPKYVRYHGKIASNSYTVTVTIQNMQKVMQIQFDSMLPRGSLLAFYTEPALAFDRKYSHQIIGKIHNGIPTVYQPFNTAYHGWMAMNCDKEMTVCFDAYSFWNGQWNNTFSPPFDKCCLAGIITIERETVYTLAYGESAEDACKNSFIDQSSNIELPSKNQWVLKSSDKTLDVMTNHFLPHQVLTARLFARTGFYQCSGAFGFRDQLQDAGNIVFAYPDLTKKQILLCCSRQFIEGDVLHWWHELPAGPAGVRTRCSDDLLWLPLYTARYITITGDYSILANKVSYLSAPLLAEQEQERYDSHFGVEPNGTVYEHCKKALNAVKFSHRGLALIGSCDWNDGFSSVGIEGKGESVWLTQFFAMVCEAFVPLAEFVKEDIYAKQLLSKAADCKKSVELYCWDDDHYTRAYFDDGGVIGASSCLENKLDVLPQAFAVFANLPNTHRNKEAILTAYNRLVDHKNQLIRLFSPAFDKINAGYISAYPAGIRENGGQYTHGVIWLIQALLRIGEAEKAYQLIRYINPASHCESDEIADRYQGEPFAVAGDVYTHPDVIGKSGWTHYTGAAGWLYRIIWEEMIGIRIESNKIIIQPVLPKALFKTKCFIKIGETSVEIQFNLTKPYNKKTEMLLDGKKHSIIINDDSSE